MSSFKFFSLSSSHPSVSKFCFLVLQEVFSSLDLSLEFKGCGLKTFPLDVCKVPRTCNQRLRRPSCVICFSVDSAKSWCILQTSGFRCDSTPPERAARFITHAALQQMNFCPTLQPGRKKKNQKLEVHKTENKQIRITLTRMSSFLVLLPLFWL